jgi:hypothetical protein
MFFFNVFGVLLIIWGAITIATAYGKNFAQLAVLRGKSIPTTPGAILISYEMSNQPFFFISASRRL